ncbi:MAG: hypothetical protein GX558_11855 [Clostridiales bacterium]|nr:hypothetical protein [Clostridiales bacterium]
MSKHKEVRAMRCPHCGREAGGLDLCPGCGRAIGPGSRPAPRSRRAPLPGLARAVKPALLIVSWALSLAVLALGVYKAYYWAQALMQERAYATGRAQAPAVDDVALDDGRVGHAITFYGEDGDAIYIEELRRSYMVIGGVARVEVPDGDWFDLKPEDVESAQVTITPVRIAGGGARTLLPTMTLDIAVPQSPLELISPSGEYTEVYSSIYPLKVQVVPGSTVLVDGDDVTDIVDRAGLLAVNVAVYPKGDNPISLLVYTPHHKQTRRDIVLYRAALEIPLELNVSTEKTSSRATMTISGYTAPGAKIVVDSPHVDGSIAVADDGEFSFAASFTTIGDNEVRFRATMAGKQDSVITLTVAYVPTLAEYSRGAWRMDYDQLKRLTDTWKGRVFLCKGAVTQVLPGDPQVIVMNVGTDDNPQLVALDNRSSLGSAEVGVRYAAYADVTGIYNLDGARLPRLTARYIDPVN